MMCKWNVLCGGRPDPRWRPYHVTGQSWVFCGPHGVGVDLGRFAEVGPWSGLCGAWHQNFAMPLHYVARFAMPKALLQGCTHLDPS